MQPTVDTVIEPRSVPLGGPRAMPVLRSLPSKGRKTIGAWCFADTFGPVSLADAEGMVVPPHPHTGLQTVSWVVAGEIEHRDSIGSVHTVRPGGVHVMTAGNGICHSEYSTASSTVLHGVQLWIALPERYRAVAPQFTALHDVPSITVGDAAVRVFTGSPGKHSRIPTYSPLLGAEVSFATAGFATIPLQPDWEYGVLALTEGIAIGDTVVPVGGIAIVPAHSSVSISGSDNAIAVLLGGAPLNDPFVMFWNFIGAKHDDVATAREDWMQERDSNTRPRFGTVIDDEREPLAAPRVPDVVLLPEGRAARR